MRCAPPVLSCALALGLVGCIANPPGPTPTALREPEGGIQHEALASLAADFWEWKLDDDPVQATWLGDPERHGQLPRLTHGARVAHEDRLRGLMRRERLLPDEELLNAEDTLTREILRFELFQAATQHDLDLDAWTLDPLEGPWAQLLALAPNQPIETRVERAQLVERWRAADRWLRESTARYASGARAGRTSNRTAYEKALQQLDAILATDPFDSPLVAVATGGGEWVELPVGATVARVALEHYGDARRQTEIRALNRHLQQGDELSVGTRVLLPVENDRLSPDERGEFLADVLQAVRGEIYPALADLRATLIRDVGPRVRSDGEPGLVHLDEGEALYARLVRHHTTLDLTASEVHEFGLEEVARIEAEIRSIGQRVFGTDQLAEIQRRLREDPAMHFETRAQVANYARDAMARAESAVPAYFNRLPRAACEVVEVPRHEEADSTIAYYRSPAADGTRPGRYYINTYQPETRPRYEAAVLAYHEAVPGHHTQLAIAQELDGLPLFRRHSGPTAYVEGWALYTERLCDEMGLFDSDIDRLGMLSFDAWRASRLVVDTGLHAFGWSRQRAIDYLFAHTLLAANNCANEVDRYIAWPGQALAYKIGQREILSLRAEAEARLGANFSLPAFHDEVLESGAVPLGVLRARIERWIQDGGR